MYPYQLGGEENRFHQGESENNPLEIGRDPEADFNNRLVRGIQSYLGNPHNSKQPSGGRHSGPLQDPNDGEQPSGNRHSRPLKDPSDGEQPSGDRHSRLLEDPNGGEQSLGDKTSESEIGKQKKRPGEMVITELILF